MTTENKLAAAKVLLQMALYHLKPGIEANKVRKKIQSFLKEKAE